MRASRQKGATGGKKGNGPKDHNQWISASYPKAVFLWEQDSARQLKAHLLVVFDAIIRKLKQMENLGIFLVSNGGLQNTTDSRSPWEHPELQKPGNSIMGNGTIRTVWRSQNRNKWWDAVQDRGNWQRILRIIEWERQGSCKTGMMSVGNSGFEMNNLLQFRPQTVESGGLWWSDCRQFFIMATVAGTQKVHCKFWETSCPLTYRSFYFFCHACYQNGN